MQHLSPKSHCTSTEIPESTSPTERNPSSDTYADVCHLVYAESPKQVVKNSKNLSSPHPSINSTNKEFCNGSNAACSTPKSAHIKHFKSKDHNLPYNYEDMSGCFNPQPQPPAEDLHLKQSRCVPMSDYGSMCTTSSSSLETADHQTNRHEELMERIQRSYNSSNKFYEQNNHHSIASSNEKSRNYDTYDGCNVDNNRTSNHLEDMSLFSPPLLLPKKGEKSNYENHDEICHTSSNSDKGMLFFFFFFFFNWYF